MTVYLDIVFLENICMNYIIIYATVLLLKLNNKPFRILLGSVIGAIYAVLSVTKIFEVYNTVFLKILISVIIIYVSVDAKTLKSLLKALIVFYIVSFTFGGIALALLYFVKPENILMKNGVYIGTYPIKMVLFGGIVGFILISIFYSIIKNRYKKKKICEVEISMEGKKKLVKALIDSGNFLKEPITGVPVVVVETTYLFQLVPNEILNNIDSIIVGNTDVLNVNGEEDEEKREEINSFLSKFRVIPFNSLGKENGLLLGVKADYIKVIENGEYEHEKLENVIIGMYNKKLSKDGLYNAIIGADLLEK